MPSSVQVDFEDNSPLLPHNNLFHPDSTYIHLQCGLLGQEDSNQVVHLDYCRSNPAYGNPHVQKYIETINTSPFAHHP